ncbi:GPW/gp25 family protein [Sorangium sp. So ce385]|uniref:GPW/gp25 family protein n=1 Tax=Sorangium sp. So ce385 TaxID=3133308 RepID=UPI003F5BEBFF
MAIDDPKDTYSSFLGTGWSFPPEFVQNGKEIVMTSDEEDIRSSLEILFGTAEGERFMNPKYGLDVHELLFEPAGTTVRTFLKDRIRAAILIYEPRIKLLSVEIDSPDPNAGSLRISIDYEVRATNSRYNLVYPFYKHDSNEVRAVTG